MIKPKQNLVGKQFGHLTVLKQIPHKRRYDTRWECLCVCGKTTEATTRNLNSNNHSSCGCLSRARNSKIFKERHTIDGRSSHPLYHIWSNMIYRCERPTNKLYYAYGKRGIKVHQSWHDIYQFAKDMGPRPSLTHSIDRINNDGNYEPGNCRWATMKEQANNRHAPGYHAKP